MLPVAGKPILQWVVEWLARQGISKAVVGVAHEKEKIMEYFQDGSRFGLDLMYSTHTVEGGTAQGFRLAIERYIHDDSFIAMNGDELSNINLESLFEYHIKYKPTATVCVSQLKSPFGVVAMDEDNKVIDFREKSLIESVYVSMGIYVFQREILQYLPETGDVERTAFVSLARKGKLRGYRHSGLWITINTLKDLKEADRILSSPNGW
jgi:NDP-sugar pyrophosphorylase family protein